MVQLANLIALRQIWIEIVLPVKYTVKVNLRLDAQSGADGLCHAFFVHHWQHAWQSTVDQCHIMVWGCAEGGRSTTEQFGGRRDLGVHLKANHNFPFAGAAFDCLSHGISPLFYNLWDRKKVLNTIGRIGQNTIGCIAICDGVFAQGSIRF